MPQLPDKLPEGGKAWWSRLAHQFNALRECVRSLMPAETIDSELDHSAIGVTRRPISERVSSQPEGELDIPEWDDTGYEEGDYVRRTSGVSSGAGGETPAADAEGADAAQRGRRLGIWRALEDISDGSGEAPSLDSDAWEFISGLGVEAFALQKDAIETVEGGSIYASVRNIPKIEIISGDGNRRINLDLDNPVMAGRVIQAREVDVCVAGVRKRMVVLCSEPYAI